MTDEDWSWTHWAAASWRSRPWGRWFPWVGAAEGWWSCGGGGRAERRPWGCSDCFLPGPPQRWHRRQKRKWTRGLPVLSRRGEPNLRPGLRNRAGGGPSAGEGAAAGGGGWWRCPMISLKRKKKKSNQSESQMNCLSRVKYSDSYRITFLLWGKYSYSYRSICLSRVAYIDSYRITFVSWVKYSYS